MNPSSPAYDSAEISLPTVEVSHSFPNEDQKIKIIYDILNNGEQAKSLQLIPDRFKKSILNDYNNIVDNELSKSDIILKIGILKVRIYQMLNEK